MSCLLYCYLCKVPAAQNSEETPPMTTPSTHEPTATEVQTKLHIHTASSLHPVRLHQTYICKNKMTTTAGVTHCSQRCSCVNNNRSHTAASGFRKSRQPYCDNSYTRIEYHRGKKQCTYTHYIPIVGNHSTIDLHLQK